MVPYDKEYHNVWNRNSWKCVRLWDILVSWIICTLAKAKTFLPSFHCFCIICISPPGLCQMRCCDTPEKTPTTCSTSTTLWRMSLSDVATSRRISYEPCWIRALGYAFRLGCCQFSSFTFYLEIGKSKEGLAKFHDWYFPYVRYYCFMDKRITNVSVVV